MAIDILERSRNYLAKPLASLAVRDFRYLTLGNVAQGYGQWFQTIGLPLMVYAMTGSGAQLGLITGLRGGIVLVASPLGGILSDRMSRRTVIIVASLMAALQAGALAFLVARELAQLWHLYLFALLEGAANGVNQTARAAFVRDVVEPPQIPNAVALASIAQNLTRVTGPPVAGALYGFLGPEVLFLGLAALKVLSVVFTLPISRVTRQMLPQGRTSALRSLGDGMRYAYGDKMVLALLIIGVIPPVLIIPYFNMLPFFAYDVLHSDAQGMGWLASALGWGSLVGLGWMAFAGDFRRKGLVMFVTLLMYAFLILAFARSESFALSMILLMVAGVFFSPAMALEQTLVLLRVRPDMTGRVMGLRTMSQGITPFGNIPMGFAVDIWGVQNSVTVFVLVGVVAIVAVFVLATSLRRA